MITQTWQGPLTSLKNRVLIPGQPAEMDPSDPHTRTFQALGYLKGPGKGNGVADLRKDGAGREERAGGGSESAGEVPIAQMKGAKK